MTLHPTRTERSLVLVPFNEITGANAGERPGFAGESRVSRRHRPGVAQFRRSPDDAYGWGCIP